MLGSGARWQAAAELLSRHFTCWLIELPGISASQPERGDFSLPGLAVWLVAALDTLALRRCALLASSWGGGIALQLCTEAGRRDRIQRLVLSAPIHPWWAPNRTQRLMLTPPVTRAAGWIGARLPASAYRPLLAPMFGDPARIPESSVRAYSAILHQPQLGRAAAAYARHWRRDLAALAPQIGRLQMPALLVWGERDRAVPLASAERLRAALPNARLAVVPTAGHMPFEELPDEFRQIVAPFLAHN